MSSGEKAGRTYSLGTAGKSFQSLSIVPVIENYLFIMVPK
jgi:hypothetical protein